MPQQTWPSSSDYRVVSTGLRMQLGFVVDVQGGWRRCGCASLMDDAEELIEVGYLRQTADHVALKDQPMQLRRAINQSSHLSKSCKSLLDKLSSRNGKSLNLSAMPVNQHLEMKTSRMTGMRSICQLHSRGHHIRNSGGLRKPLQHEFACGAFQ